MKDIAEILANLATALGIPVAIAAFLIDRVKTKRERELQTYRDMSDKYFEYLQLLFAHADLSTPEIDWAREGNPARDPRQDLLVQVAMNLGEAAYFLYQSHRSKFRQAQWDGWDTYMRDWCAHPAFVARWPEVIEQHDEGFRAYVESLYTQVRHPFAGVVHKTASTVPPSPPV